MRRAVRRRHRNVITRPDIAHDDSSTSSTPTRASRRNRASIRVSLSTLRGFFHRHRHPRVPVTPHRASRRHVNAHLDTKRLYRRARDRTASSSSSSSSTSSSSAVTATERGEIFSPLSVVVLVFLCDVVPDHDWSLGGGDCTRMEPHHEPRDER